jgi:hypothetical protein
LAVVKRWVIILVLILLVVAIPVVHLRVKTVQAIARIEGLQGRSGDFTEITKPIRTRYTQVDSAERLEQARVRMGLQSVSKLLVVRFNGEGLPYFYGFVAYDTNKQQVVKAVVDQLW